MVSSDPSRQAYSTGRSAGLGGVTRRTVDWHPGQKGFGGMLIWLRRYLVALFIVMALAGTWLAIAQWRALDQSERILKEGQSVTALIESAQSVERKSLLSYAVDLAWRGDDGKLLRAVNVPISSEFADQIIANGQLVVPTVKIRYLADEGSGILAVATEDADRQRAQSRAFGFVGLVLALTGVVGAMLLGVNWFRRLQRGNPA